MSGPICDSKTIKLECSVAASVEIETRDTAKMPNRKKNVRGIFFFFLQYKVYYNYILYIPC